MDVEDSRSLGPGHSVEVGKATWNPEVRSVRDRWEGATGRFSPRGSSELPITSIVPLMQFAAEHDELSIGECVEIIEALAASIRRQLPK